MFCFPISKTADNPVEPKTKSNIKRVNSIYCMIYYRELAGIQKHYRVKSSNNTNKKNMARKISFYDMQQKSREKKCEITLKVKERCNKLLKQNCT